MFSKETLTKDQRFVFDKETKMIYEIIPAWINYKYDFKGELHPEKHNALHRTSLALIAYKNPELLEGVKNCFRKFDMINYPKGKYWYQACRCNPRMWEDDVSRDQIIMALTALYITEKKSAKEIASHLPFKLSRRFNMVPSMYFWVKYIANEKKLWLNLFSFIFFIEIFFSFIFSFIGIFLNIKQLIYPYYSLHLSAWQLHIIPENKISKLIKSMLLKILKNRDEKNYFTRKLLGDNSIIKDHFSNYTPMNSFRWEIYKKHTKRYIRHLTKSEAAANTIDKDIINFLFSDK
jgi:hypothetical protein